VIGGWLGASSCDGGSALAQSIPLPITVDQDTTLVKDAVQEKRRLGLHPLQTGGVYTASGDALKTNGDPVTRR
jgi:hypothetical protein